MTEADHPLAAVAHWAAMGRPGSAPDERYVPKDADGLHPMRRPVRTTWAVKTDHDGVERLLRGFPRREMEDKWVVYADGPDTDGIVTVHFHRSWTGFEVARMTLAPIPTGSRVTEFIWESDTDVVKQPSEEWAKGTVAQVCHWVLGIGRAGEPPQSRPPAASPSDPAD